MARTRLPKSAAQLSASGQQQDGALCREAETGQLGSLGKSLALSSASPFGGSGMLKSRLAILREAQWLRWLKDLGRRANRNISFTQDRLVRYSGQAASATCPESAGTG